MDIHRGMGTERGWGKWRSSETWQRPAMPTAEILGKPWKILALALGEGLGEAEQRETHESARL